MADTALEYLHGLLGWDLLCSYLIAYLEVERDIFRADWQELGCGFLHLLCEGVCAPSGPERGHDRLTVRWFNCDGPDSVGLLDPIRGICSGVMSIDRSSE